MKRFAFICTRDKNLKPITKDLLTYLDSIGTKVILLIGQESIFKAYEKALIKIEAEADDQIILCHDDIKITSSPEWFNSCLNSKLINKLTGFVGVAGTKKMSTTGIWWDRADWTAGNLSGYVLHGEDHTSCYGTSFGTYAQVEVLDGLFLAATYDTLCTVGLKKPDYFEGDWDFYDVLYTYKAHKLGFRNYTVPITLMHNSPGELQGRDSWHKNREAFIEKYLTT